MLLSRRDYAKHRGVAVSTVQEAIESGRITLTNGKIDPEKADKEWAKNTNPAYHGSKNEDKSSANSYQASRAMSSTYDALNKKLDYEERIGKLISSDLARMESYTAARTARDKILSVPRRVSHKLVGKSADEIEKILLEELRESLEDLARKFDGNKS